MIPKKRQKELLLQARLEPAVLFLIGEGPWDRLVLSRALAGVHNRPMIYDVTQIEWDGYDSDEGNKGKIKQLARDQNVALPLNLVGVIDRDTDFDAGCQLESAHVAYTDYCAMEVYFLNEHGLKFIFEVGMGVELLEDEWSSLLSWVRDCYALLVARRLVIEGETLPNMAKFWAHGQFRWDHYMGVVRGNIGSNDLYDELIATWQTQKEAARPDIRMCLNFEIFVDNVCAFLKSLKKVPGSTAPIRFSDGFKLHFRFQDLHEFPLFGELTRRSLALTVE